MIPPPDMTHLKRLARVSYENMCLNIFWHEDTRQTIMNETGTSKWWAGRDSNIIEYMGEFLDIYPENLYADQIMVFDQKLRYGKTDDHLNTDIYRCEWSDFACEGLVLHFNLHV